jgi:threonine/homoserine/homoserine lactone efflux protein
MSVEFLLTSLVVVLILGAGVVYTVASSIGGGWRRGLFAAIGCTLGIVPHMLAAMLGLSGIMQAGSVVSRRFDRRGSPTSSSWACR